MGEITIRKALDDYKTINMPYRNFADRTREEYQNNLQDFIAVLEQRGITRVGELGLPNIECYVSHFEEKGLASLTKKKVVAIRSLLSFLYQDAYIKRAEYRNAQKVFKKVGNRAGQHTVIRAYLRRLPCGKENRSKNCSEYNGVNRCSFGRGLSVTRMRGRYERIARPCAIRKIYSYQICKVACNEFHLVP